MSPLPQRGEQGGRGGRQGSRQGKKAEVAASIASTSLTATSTIQHRKEAGKKKKRKFFDKFFYIGNLLCRKRKEKCKVTLPAEREERKGEEKKGKEPKQAKEQEDGEEQEEDSQGFQPLGHFQAPPGKTTTNLKNPSAGQNSENVGNIKQIRRTKPTNQNAANIDEIKHTRRTSPTGQNAANVEEIKQTRRNINGNDAVSHSRHESPYTPMSPRPSHHHPTISTTALDHQRRTPSKPSHHMEVAGHQEQEQKDKEGGEKNGTGKFFPLFLFCCLFLATAAFLWVMNAPPIDNDEIFLDPPTWETFLVEIVSTVLLWFVVLIVFCLVESKRSFLTELLVAFIIFLYNLTIVYKTRYVFRQAGEFRYFAVPWWLVVVLIPMHGLTFFVCLATLSVLCC